MLPGAHEGSYQWEGMNDPYILEVDVVHRIQHITSSGFVLF